MCNISWRGKKKGWERGEGCLLSLSLELLRMGLCLGELQSGVSGWRSAAILPSGSFNSLQLDTFKKLLISYGKLSFSAVLATTHLVCSLPLAIKLFLSDNLLSQTGWSLWSEVQAGFITQRASAKVRGSWVLLTGCISCRCEERGEAASWGETTALHRQISPSAFEEEGARDTERKPGAKIEISNCWAQELRLETNEKKYFGVSTQIVGQNLHTERVGAPR